MLSQLKEFLTLNSDNSYSDKSPVILYGRAGNHPGLEGINIFRIENNIYVQIYSTLNERDKESLQTLIFETFRKKKGDEIQFSIVDRSEKTPEMIFLSKEISEDIIYPEHYRSKTVLKYYLDLRRPSHPGIFFDIHPAREWLLDNSKNKKVLNLFAFTCPFSVCAAAGGASLIINMDNNSNVLSRGRRNHMLNNHDLSSIKFEKKDVMKSFGYINKKGPFDIIICDPPSLQKGSFNAQKEYAKLVRRLKEALSPDGILMLCLNDPFLGFDFLGEIIKKEELVETQRIAPAKPFISADNNKGLKIICTRLK